MARACFAMRQLRRTDSVFEDCHCLSVDIIVANIRSGPNRKHVISEHQNEHHEHARWARLVSHARHAVRTTPSGRSP